MTPSFEELIAEIERLNKIYSELWDEGEYFLKNFFNEIFPDHDGDETFEEVIEVTKKLKAENADLKQKLELADRLLMFASQFIMRKPDEEDVAWALEYMRDFTKKEAEGYKKFIDSYFVDITDPEQK